MAVKEADKAFRRNDTAENIYPLKEYKDDIFKIVVEHDGIN